MQERQLDQTMVDTAYADTDLRVLTQRMRTFLRGRNAGEIIGFNASGKPITCRLTGHTNSGRPVSYPTAREADATYLFFGAASQDTVAEAVATAALWTAFAEASHASTPSEQAPAAAAP